MKAYVIYRTDSGACMQSGYLPVPDVERFDNLASMLIEDVINPTDYRVEDGVLINQQTSVGYDFLRHRTYGDIGEQLGRLWHDIDAGLLGAAAKTGEFYLEIQRVKQAIPKQ